jgi:hypothetical protein
MRTEILLRAGRPGELTALESAETGGTAHAQHGFDLMDRKPLALGRERVVLHGIRVPEIEARDKENPLDGSPSQCFAELIAV